MQESKSFGRNRVYAEHLIKARALEEQVFKHYLSSGYSLVERNFRTPFAEVDLILKKAQTFVLVEVKALHDESFAQVRLSVKQRLRLQRAFLWFVHVYKAPVEFHLVFVTSCGQMRVIHDFLSEGVS